MDHQQSHLRRVVYSLGLITVFFAPKPSLASPRVALGIGVPVPARVSIEFPMTEQLELGLEGGYAPYPLPFSISIAGGAVEARAQYFPGWGPLFFAGGLGYQLLQVGMALNLGDLSPSTGPTNATFNFRIFYASLGAGCRWKLSESLAIGFDLGAQLPLVNWSNLSLPNRDAASNELATAASGALGYFSQLILPRVTLIKIGYEF